MLAALQLPLVVYLTHFSGVLVLIQIAYHGTHRYSDEEMRHIYPQPLEYKGVSTKRFWAATSYFDLPYFCVYALLIDLVDAKVADRRGGMSADELASLYEDLNRDMFQCIVHNFGDFYSGAYFREIAAATDKFIDRRPIVREWLLSLRSAGKKVFLITNSSEDYACVLGRLC